MVRPVVLWLSLAVILTALTLPGSYGGAFTLGKPAPEISGKPWLNSPPLTNHDLRGRVVLVEFWTYG